MQWQTIAMECRSSIQGGKKVACYMDHYENFPIKLIQLCNVHCHLRGFELDAIIYLTANFFIHFTTLDDREAVLDNSCVCYLPYCGSRNMLRDELWVGGGG